MLDPFELRRVQSDDDDLEDEIYCAAKNYEFEEVSDVEQFLINFRCTFFPFCASVFPCRKEISAIICRRKLISITFFPTVYRMCLTAIVNFLYFFNENFTLLLTFKNNVLYNKNSYLFTFTFKEQHIVFLNVILSL